MKKIYLFLVVFVCLICLTACHGQRVDVNDEEFVFEAPLSFDETKTHNISFWAKNDTNIVQKNIYLKAIEDFEKLYPNINVEIVQYTDYGRIYEDVIKNIATKTTPNVCIAYPDHVATYMEGNGVVVPLDSLIDNSNYGLGGTQLKFDGVKKEDLIEKFFEECIINEHHYMVPFVRSTEALYINKTYLEENGFNIPEIFTWDYVWQICKFAEEKSLTENQKMTPLIYKSTDNMFIQLCKQYGYEFTKDNGEVLFLSDEVKEMLLELSDYANKGYFSTFKKVSYPGNHFNKGQCIFAIDSTAGATWIGQDAPLVDISKDEIAEFETIVRPIPQVNVEDPKMISQGPSLCVFNKEDSQEVVASWLFTQFLLTNDIQNAYTQTEGYLPVTQTAINSEEFKEYMNDEDEYYIKRDATQIIIDNIDNTFITPVFNGSSSARNAAGYLIEAIFNKKYQNEEGIEQLYSNVDSRYNLSTYVIGDFKDKLVIPELSIQDKRIKNILILSIGLVWLGIGIYLLKQNIVKKSKNKR